MIPSGTRFETKFNGMVEVIQYKNHKHVKVRFVNTGFETITQSLHLRDGTIKDYYAPRVWGVGFIGVGNFAATKNRMKTDMYSSWNHMLERCYCDKWQSRNKSYIGCYVVDEWHNFQNFAEFYVDNYPNDGNIYQLDKDILGGDNKCYSPDTCKFVTQQDNIIFASAKHFTFVSPSGKITEVYNLSEFSREHGLTQQHMSKVHAGKAKHHKQWRKYNGKD